MRMVPIVIERAHPTPADLRGPPIPLMPELFRETAGRWPDDGWTALPVGLDVLAARLGADELVRVDERAATLGGARIPAAGDVLTTCHLPTPGASCQDQHEARPALGSSRPEKRAPDLDDVADAVAELSSV